MMSGVGELLLRMVVSLAVVLTLVAVAYTYARRRNGAGGLRPSARRRSNSVGRLEVESRVGLARGSAAVAVRFGHRVVLVAVNDGAPSSVLAELPAEEWDADRVDPDELGSGAGPFDGTTRAVGSPLDPNGIVSQRPTFLEALRTATSRRP